MGPHPGAFREHAFLASLSAGQRERLAACAREVEYRAGAFVFHEGGPADTLYLIHRGHVALEQHVPGRGVTTLESLAPGDILGLSWISPPARWTLDARCVDAVHASALDVECLRGQLTRDDALAHEVLARLAEALYRRLVRVRLQRLDVYGEGAAE